MDGMIQRILPNGKIKHLGPSIKDLAFLGYSYFTRNEKRKVPNKKREGAAVVDILFNRLMMGIVKQYTRDRSPSIEDLIDEIGSHPLIVQRYGRAISYDDVLPPVAVMEKYMTGQRQVTIRIGSESMSMTPETLVRWWGKNPWRVEPQRNP